MILINTYSPGVVPILPPLPGRASSCGLRSVPNRSCKTKFASSKIKNYKEGNSINIDLWENGFLKSLLDS